MFVSGQLPRMVSAGWNANLPQRALFPNGKKRVICAFQSLYHPLMTEPIYRSLSRSDSDDDEQITEEKGETFLSVYFPTKEKTRLKFCLHAPMLLTLERANVQENHPTNSSLIRSMCLLAC